jgi:hypothetical protein
MDISTLAELCSEIWAGGKQNNDRTLDKRDFEPLIDAARGKVVQNAYWMARKYSLDIQQSGFLNSYVEEGDFDINDKNEIILPSKVLSLPHGWGVYSIIPIDNECDVDFIRIDAGTAWKISVSGSTEEVFFEVFSNKIKVHNKPGCLNKVKVLHVPEIATNVSSDLIFDIINIIFTLMFKVKGFPIDQQADGNPNVGMVNKKIAEAQLQ